PACSGSLEKQRWGGVGLAERRLRCCSASAVLLRVLLGGKWGARRAGRRSCGRPKVAASSPVSGGVLASAADMVGVDSVVGVGLVAEGAWAVVDLVVVMALEVAAVLVVVVALVV
ncbi:unnamed protein product, partial [Musa hybrid cultivar]